MKLVFLGPPGAGKGTLALEVSKKFDIAHISTGDMLREQLKKGTELGTLAKSYIDAGQLVPDGIIIGMVKNRLYEDDCKKGFILDGFPRTAKQAAALDDVVNIDAAINFEIEDERVASRISGRRICSFCGEVYHVKWLKEGQNTCGKCGGSLIIRPDDNEDTVRNRLIVYKNQTAPLIGYYDKKGVLKNINADASVEECFFAIASIIGKL